MKSSKVLVLLMATSLISFMGVVQADAGNLISNGEFTTGLSDWTQYGGGFVWNDGSAGTSDGGYAEFTGPGWIVGNAVAPPVSLIEGQTYEFSFSAVLLYDNGNAIDRSIYASAGTADNSAVIQQELTSTWTEYSATFIATADDVGADYSAAFLNSLNYWTGYPSNTPANCVFGIDNVSLKAAEVPEPSVLVLACAGLLGLLFWRKRS